MDRGSRLAHRHCYQWTLISLLLLMTTLLFHILFDFYSSPYLIARWLCLRLCLRHLFRTTLRTCFCIGSWCCGRHGKRQGVAVTYGSGVCFGLYVLSLLTIDFRLTLYSQSLLLKSISWLRRRLVGRKILVLRRCSVWAAAASL